MAQDIIIDETGDLNFLNGDFQIGISDEQHAVLLINTMPGSWKQFPTAGVGIIQYSASAGQSGTLKRNINVQMEKDGFTNINVVLSTNNTDQYDYFVTADRTDGL